MRCASGSIPTKSPSRGHDRRRRVLAVQEQNIQVSAGQLGAEPMQSGSDFLIPINAQGRLRTVEEFGDIVLKTGADRRDRAPVPMSRASNSAATTTACAGELDNQDARIIGVFQAPGANALTVRDEVIAKMDELARRFPPGMTWRSDYDTTIFVRDSIDAVVRTLLEASCSSCSS